MFDPLTLKIAEGVMLGIFLAACSICLVVLFVSAKGADKDQPRSGSAIRAGLFMLGASIAVFLLTQWLMGGHGIMSLLNPFLIPVVITAKGLLLEISKPRPRRPTAPSAD